MNKVNIERAKDQSPEELAARAKEIEEFVKKDYQENRAMMDKLAEGIEIKEPVIFIMDYRTIQKYLRSVNYYGFFDSKTYIISFYGEGEKKVDFSNCKAHVCQLYIDDIIVPTDKDEFYKQYHGIFITVARFIVEAISTGKKIVCQCNAGVSRSAATAKAIKEYFFGTGYEIDEDGSYIPNPLFFESILKALDEIRCPH